MTHRQRQSSTRRTTCVFSLVILCSSFPLLVRSSDFDDASTSTTSNVTITSSPTIPKPPTMSPTSSPTLPPHRQHNKCPLKPRFNPPEITRDNLPPIVIGHRGASYNVPEHTLAGYRLALELGADYIEPDLVPTKDGHLVAIHSVDLNITTNVADVFPTRKRRRMPDDSPDSGYYVQDFTLEEIQQLHVRQRVEDTPARSRYFDGLFTVPSISQIIDLLYEWNTNARPYIGLDKQKIKGRAGMYAELKRPVYLQQDAGINMADLFIKEMKSNPKAKEMFLSMKECANLKADEYQVPPLVLQCFDGATLTHLHEKFTTDEELAFGSFPPPMVLLLSYHDCSTKEDIWFSITKMNVAAVGPDKRCLLESTNEGMGLDFVNSAKEHELAVHPWTERLETEFVDTDRFATAEEELRHLFCELEIDGIFAENVDVAVRVGKMGCPKNEEEEEEMEEEEAKEEYEGGTGSTESESDAEYNQYKETLCDQSNQRQLAIAACSFTMFGILIGSTCMYAANFHFNKRRVHRGTSRRQVQVPTAEIRDENELI